jgi:hypothetical protein
MPDERSERLIIVHASATDEVNASGADLMVTVEGASLFSGKEALRKAKELRRLIDALGRFGLDEDDIMVEGIEATSQAGLLTRSSSALYRLRIGCDQLELLADILEIITAQKTARLEQTLWRYDGLGQTRASLLGKCADEAARKATTIALTLGVALGPIHRLVELGAESSAHDPGHFFGEQAANETAGVPTAVRRRTLKDELSFAIVNRRPVRVAVQAEFAIGPPAPLRSP